MHRLFVALCPPPEIRAILAATMGGVPGARWQDDDQLHLTLRFIGAVEQPVAEDVAAAMASIVAPIPAVRIAGVGRFEQRGRTDTLWAAVTPGEALAALHRKVDQALVRVGLDPERRAYLPTSRSRACRAAWATAPRSKAGSPNTLRFRANHSCFRT